MKQKILDALAKLLMHTDLSEDAMALATEIQSSVSDETVVDKPLFEELVVDETVTEEAEISEPEPVEVTETVPKQLYDDLEAKYSQLKLDYVSRFMGNTEVQGVVEEPEVETEDEAPTKTIDELFI